MSELRVLLRTFLVEALLLQVYAIDVTTTWLNDTIIGTTATLQCSWTPSTGEVPSTLYFSPNNNSIPYYFTCVISTGPPHTCTRGALALDRHNISSTVRESVSMLITNLPCSDDGTSYFCLVAELYKPPIISQSLLKVKVRPTVPTLSNTIQIDVQENSNITATCTAGVGYPNAGQIVWKAFKNGQSVDLSSELIITAVNVTPPVDRCTVRTQSSVTLKANRLHQNISLACFVTNPDFKPTAPETCTDPATDLCAQTNPVVVTYPVSSLSVSREPVSTLYEGGTATLKCQAEGNPLPTYTWTKVGDRNKTLAIGMDGLVSTVTLTSLNKTLDAGDYNCTASNVIKTVIYSTSGVIPLVIYEATTTAPTTTTTVKTTKTTTNQLYGSTQSTGPESSANNTANDSDSNTVSIIVISVILSAIIIVQFVVILVLCRRNKASNGLCKPNLAERKPHTYDRAEEKESPYDSYYKSIEI